MTENQGTEYCVEEITFCEINGGEKNVYRLVLDYACARRIPKNRLRDREGKGRTRADGGWERRKKTFIFLRSVNAWHVEKC